MFTIPNIITLVNLLCGCIGITLVLQGDAQDGALWVWIAAVLDFFDGFAARMLKSVSPIGKDLDSLADMVSFGILPSVVLYRMLEPGLVESIIGSQSDYLPYFAFLIALFSALRLAKFNNDTRQSDSFRGLPTPANAFFITALPFVDYEWMNNTYLIVGIIVVFSLLLVSEIRMFALKFKSLSVRENAWKYLGLALSLTLIIILREKALPIIILGYILISLIINARRRTAQ